MARCDHSDTDLKRKSKFIYQRLRDCRDRQGLSRDKVVIALSKNNALSIVRDTLENWEKGKTSPNAVQLAELAIFYNKPIEYFFATK